MKKKWINLIQSYDFVEKDAINPIVEKDGETKIYSLKSQIEEFNQIYITYKNTLGNSKKK